MDRQRTKRRVFIVGIGQTKFLKPGGATDYPEMVGEAVNTALKDAQLQYTDLQAAAVGYFKGATCSGQRALYEIGMTGIPIINCNNACATGSTAMFIMKRFIESGDYDCVLATGFEKMQTGSLQLSEFTDRADPVERYAEVMSETYGVDPAPMTPQMFGMAGKEHMEKYGSTALHSGKIAWKNHKHASNNPDAQFRKEYSLDEIMNSRKIWDFVTLLMCSPTSDGAAAAIFCSEEFLRHRPALKDQAVEILGMELGTDFPSTFNENSNIKNVGFDLILAAAKRLYKSTGLTPNDVQVIECHDCFAPNELLTYEALGLCPIGKAGELVDRGDNTYGGKWVINPSGGLISKGHPIGATGVSQCIELCKHLRGIAGARQVPNCKVALQHNLGIGSAGVVAMYKLAFPKYPGANEVSKPIAIQMAEKTKGEVSFKSDVVFAEIQRRAMGKEGDLAKQVKGSFQFVITGPGGAVKKWYLDTKVEPPFVGQKEAKANVTVTMSDDTFIAIATKQLKPDQAFMQGKLKFKGNMGLMMKIRNILENLKLEMQAKL